MRMKAAMLFVGVLMASAGAVASSVAYSYETWSRPIKDGACTTQITIVDKSGKNGTIQCEEQDHLRTYLFPAGIFEIDEQLLIPPRTTIRGARNPNDMSNPTKSPSWTEQTLFLSTRGVKDFHKAYCMAKDMVKTRVGFVLSSFTTVANISFQGLDTIRPCDNGGLCGGGVFETKGCAVDSCRTPVNNAGSDGKSVENVSIQNVRLNDYYYAEDKAKIGAYIPGNSDCTANDDCSSKCCHCKPNGVRTSQVAIKVSPTRDAATKGGVRNFLISNIVSRSTQADAINIDGHNTGIRVSNAYFENTGDDIYAVAGNPENIVFEDCVGVNPGIMRPRWYGNCVATYGFKSVLYKNLTCRAPTIWNPLPLPGDGRIAVDTSMVVVYTSFGGKYSKTSNMTIDGYSFTNLEGVPYTEKNGSMDNYTYGKMVWSRSTNGVLAPLYFCQGSNCTQRSAQEPNVYVHSLPSKALYV